MGPPIYIINNTQKSYISTSSSLIWPQTLEPLLKMVAKLVEEKQWSSKDDVVTENISGDSKGEHVHCSTNEWHDDPTPLSDEEEDDEDDPIRLCPLLQYKHIAFIQ